MTQSQNETISAQNLELELNASKASFSEYTSLYTYIYIMNTFTSRTSVFRENIYIERINVAP